VVLNTFIATDSASALNPALDAMLVNNTGRCVMHHTS